MAFDDDNDIVDEEDGVNGDGGGDEGTGIGEYMGASLAGQGAQGRGGEASEGDDEGTDGERGEKRRLESTSGVGGPVKKRKRSGGKRSKQSFWDKAWMRDRKENERK